MFGGQSGSATGSSPSLLEMRKLGVQEGLTIHSKSHSRVRTSPRRQCKGGRHSCKAGTLDIATWHCLLLTHAGWTATGHTPGVLITQPWMFPASTPPPSPSPPPNPASPPPALTAPPLPQVPVLKPMDLMVEVSPRRVFANGHTYHINSISVNSDCETYMSADDLRINLWHLAITDRSFSILSCRSPAADSMGWAHPGQASVGLL